MVNLEDCLAALLLEITKARVQADLEAIRITQFYTSDPLLAKMPIPHFRLPNVTIDIPIIIKDVHEKGEIPADGKKIIDDFKAVFTPMVISLIKETGFDEINEDKLTVEINSLIDSIDLTPEIPIKTYINVPVISKKIISKVSKTLHGFSRERGRDNADYLQLVSNLNENLKPIIYTEFLNLSLKVLPKSPYVDVLVTTAELQAVRPNEVTRFHLSISEDAFEYIENESDDKLQNHLIPE